jgi:DNA-binding transcriptional regulator YiaG
MSKEENDKTLGQEIIEGLSELRDAVRNKVPLHKKFTIRDVELDLRPRSYDAQSVKDTRYCLQVSQAVFAEMLGVSKECVQKWEQGLGAPSGAACRLMDVINYDPEGWFKTLEHSLKEKDKDEVSI